MPTFKMKEETVKLIKSSEKKMTEERFDKLLDKALHLHLIRNHAERHLEFLEWVEKYCPQELDDMREHEEEVMHRLIENRRIRNAKLAEEAAGEKADG